MISKRNGNRAENPACQRRWPPPRRSVRCGHAAGARGRGARTPRRVWRGIFPRRRRRRVRSGAGKRAPGRAVRARSGGGGGASSAAPNPSPRTSAIPRRAGPPPRPRRAGRRALCHCRGGTGDAATRATTAAPAASRASPFRPRRASIRSRTGRRHFPATRAGPRVSAAAIRRRNQSTPRIPRGPRAGRCSAQRSVRHCAHAEGCGCADRRTLRALRRSRRSTHHPPRSVPSPRTSARAHFPRTAQAWPRDYRPAG